MRRRFLIAAFVVLAACSDGEPGALPQPGGSQPGPGGSPERVAARVVHVVDGDTIRVVLNGDEVPIRLIGIDTPEVDGPYTERECFGREATEYARAALDAREVGLEFDVERRDRFDRVLAYVWEGDRLVNERIIRDGYAVVATFPPNIRYVDRFVAAERDARGAGRGLWSACR